VLGRRSRASARASASTASGEIRLPQRVDGAIFTKLSAPGAKTATSGELAQALFGNAITLASADSPSLEFQPAAARRTDAHHRVGQ